MKNAALGAMIGTAILSLILFLGSLPLEEAVREAQLWQRYFHVMLADGVRESAAGRINAAPALIGASFVYGVLHAIGPGHGKAVIVTYLAARPSRMKRAILLPILASLMQGATAVAVIGGSLFLAGLLSFNARTAALWSERAGFVLLAVVGAVFLGQAGFRLQRLVFSRRATHQKGVCLDDRVHDHGCGCCGPTAEQINEIDGWGATLGLVAAIGLRPCSGAILVLILAESLGVFSVGVLAVIAMSIGTAIIVSALAVLTVVSRNGAAALSRKQGGVFLPVFGQFLSGCGGAVLFFMGVLLFMGSFETAIHPILSR